MKNAFAIAGVLMFAACTHEYQDAKEPPQLRVLSPERGATREGIETVEVTGTYGANSEGTAVTRIAVNGVDATLNADGTFVAQVDLLPGATLLHTTATDAAGTEAFDTRAVLAGEVRPTDSIVNEGLSIGLSDMAFEKIGNVAAGLVETTDLGAMVSAFNPVLNAGNGPDCLYAIANVQSGLDLNTADIRLVPFSGGLQLEVDLTDVIVPAHATYAAACVDGESDIAVTADRVSIRGDLMVSVVGGAFDVQLANPYVSFDNFNVDATGLPGAVVDIIDFFDIQQAVGNALAGGMESFMAPMVADALANVPGQGRFEVMGSAVDVSVTPASVDFDPSGAQVRLNTRVFVVGSKDIPGYVFTDNQDAPARNSEGVELALADDAVNQMLAGFWAVGGLDRTIPHDMGMFDALSLDALLPPVVSTDPEGNLRIIVGDMGVTFLQDDVAQMKVSANLSFALKILPVGEGRPVIKLALEQPTMWFDVVDDIPNFTGMDAGDLEGLFPIVIEKTIEHLAPFLETIPLPALYGITVTDFSVGGTDGYVLVKGDIR